MSSREWITFRPPEPGETAEPGSTVLGTIPCHDCGETMLLKYDSGRKAYAYCNQYNPDADRWCSATLKYGAKTSAAIVADWSKTKPAEPLPEGVMMEIDDPEIIAATGVEGVEKIHVKEPETNGQETSLDEAEPDVTDDGNSDAGYGDAENDDSAGTDAGTSDTGVTRRRRGRRAAS